jgi:CheY-like chemotaxis protein
VEFPPGKVLPGNCLQDHCLIVNHIFELPAKSVIIDQQAHWWTVSAESNLALVYERIVYKYLPHLALGLGSYYCLITIAHAYLAAPGVAPFMVGIAGFSAFTLLGICIWLKTFPPLVSRAHLVETVMAEIVLLNCLAHLYFLPDLKQTTNVALAIIGGGLLIRRVLERRGFSIVTAGDGAEALQVFQSQTERIVLVVLDLTMPRMGGRETLQRLRAIRPDVSTILTSGYNQDDVIENITVEPTGFLHKPFTPQELLAAVSRALPGHGHLAAGSS